MSKAKKAILFLGDVCALYVSLALALLIRYQNPAAMGESFSVHTGPFSAIFILWLMAFYWNDLYRPKAFQGSIWLIKAIARAVFISTVGSIAAFYLFPRFFELTPRANLFIFAGVFFVIAYIWRSNTNRFLSSGALHTIILGSSPLIDEAVALTKSNPHSDYKVVHWDKTPDENTLSTLPELIKKLNAQIVITQHHLTNNFSALRSIYKLLPLEVTVMPFSDFYEALFEKAPLKELEEAWFIENISTRRPAYDLLKRAMDVSIAIVVGIILFVPALLIALLIALTSRGPVIYTQERMGKNGIPFTLYKFRTMKHNAGGALWTEEKDTRITRIGSILRYTHLDELPQILNILKNDISLVGPRPERVELVKQYEQFPYYEIRHVIKPGLTGWAQVNFRPSASLEEAYEKLCYDVYYVQNRSILLDLIIFLRTVKYLVTSYTK